jgi:glycerate kinase
LISGSVDRAALVDLGRHFAGSFSLPFGPSSLEQCVADAAALLADRAEQAGQLFDAARR